MVDSSSGYVLVQGDNDDQLVELANLQICTAKASTPDLHDKNSCFRVSCYCSPTIAICPYLSHVIHNFPAHYSQHGIHFSSNDQS